MTVRDTSRKSSLITLRKAALAAGLLAAISAPAALAAAQQNSLGTFKGFGNNKEPIQIEADNMGVASADQVVTITGNVHVQQKDATLTTQTLKVFYDQSQKPAAANADGPAGQLRRFEASGGLKITEPDQSVTGDSGWFDIPSQKAEVTGNVVLTQNKNVARGSKLLINLATGEYKLLGGGPGSGNNGRVILLLDPNAKEGQGAQGKTK